MDRDELLARLERAKSGRCPVPFCTADLPRNHIMCAPHWHTLSAKGKAALRAADRAGRPKDFVLALGAAWQEIHDLERLA